MSKKDNLDNDKDGQMLLEKEPKTKKPSLYRVIMLNDDSVSYTHLPSPRD